MFTIEEREAASNHIVAMARSDPRIVAAAVIGSLAFGKGDRWSDIDLTFAIEEGVPVMTVLEDWTRQLEDEMRAVFLFDLPSGATIYRVYFLPGGLQVDLSVTPSSSFAPGGPRFRLLFGETGEERPRVDSPARELFGWAVAYAREARACIARERWWQAEHSINALRDNALSLACRRRGLPTGFGRGYDDLPPEALAQFEDARAASLRPEDLFESLSVAVDGLLAESEEVGEVAARTGPLLRALLEEPI
jgi:hypothetical protein